MNTEYQTDRLLLKLLPPNYSQEVLSFQTRNQELFEKYEPTRPQNFYTRSYQHAILKYEYKSALQLSTVRFYVFHKQNPHTIIGTVCLHNIYRGVYSCCELGYKFDSTWHHQGYAKEATQKMIHLAFYELRLHRIFARVVPENTPSIHLLQSLHFQEEGLERASIQIRGIWTDHMRYALLSPLP